MKQKIAKEKKAKEDEEKREAEELRKIIQKIAEIEEKDPELYKKIKEEATQAFDETMQKNKMFEVILTAKIRSIVGERYLKKK